MSLTRDLFLHLSTTNAHLYLKQHLPDFKYEYKGSIVTGRLNKKSLNGTGANPIWIVTPTDRRRRDEEIPENQFGKVISAIEAMNNRAPKLGTKDDQKEAGLTRNVTPITSSNSSSDGSGNEEPTTSASIKNKRRGGRLTPSNDSHENSKAASRSSMKRSSTSDDSHHEKDMERAPKIQKTVKFSQPSKESSSKMPNVAKEQKTAPARVGTRSTRGSSEMVLLPENPRKKGVAKKVEKKFKRNQNVVVVKMLTGTLYLHRGDRRRAEFIRFK